MFGLKPTEMNPVTVLGAVPNVLDVGLISSQDRAGADRLSKANPGKGQFCLTG